MKKIIITLISIFVIYVVVSIILVLINPMFIFIVAYPIIIIASMFSGVSDNLNDMKTNFIETSESVAPDVLIEADCINSMNQVTMPPRIEKYLIEDGNVAHCLINDKEFVFETTYFFTARTKIYEVIDDSMIELVEFGEEYLGIGDIAYTDAEEKKMYVMTHEDNKREIYVYEDSEIKRIDKFADSNNMVTFCNSDRSKCSDLEVNVKF